MGRDRSAWQHGRRAWERLGGWHQDGPSAPPGHPDDGDEALTALADVGAIRRLLDQAELVAVRTARRHGKSWAEIATRLGVTRQSAWERWRDLDDAETAHPVGTGASPEPAEVVAGAATELVGRRARAARRRSSVAVPNVIGRSWDEARHALLGESLVAVGSDPDAPPPLDPGMPGVVVTDQSPESGARVPAGSSVRLWLGRGGGSAGVREPRRPSPTPKTAREMRSEVSDEAVG